MTHRFSLFPLALVVAVCCARHDAMALRTGGSLHLTVIVTSPRTISPTRAAILGAISDTGQITLRIERVAQDSAWGHYDGPARSFWPMFRGLNSTFVLARVGAQWHIQLDYDATDAGLWMTGTLSADKVRGTWHGAMGISPKGTFVLVPGA